MKRSELKQMIRQIIEESSVNQKYNTPEKVQQAIGKNPSDKELRLFMQQELLDQPQLMSDLMQFFHKDPEDFFDEDGNLLGVGKTQYKTSGVEESFESQPKIRTIINSIRSESRDAKEEIDFILEREGTTFNRMSDRVEQDIADMLEEEFPELWSETIIDQTSGVEESFVVDSKKELNVFEEGLVTNLAKAAGTAVSKVVSAVQGVGALLKKGMEMAKTFKQTAVKRYDQVQRQTAAKGKAATWVSQMLKPTIKEAALTITDLNKLVYDPKKVAAALADEESGVAASYIIANFVTATTQMAESIQALKGLLTEANETVAPAAAPAAPATAATGATPTTQPGVQQAGKNYGTRKMAEESKNTTSRFFKYGNK